MKRILFSMACIFLIHANFAEAGISDKNAKLIRAAKEGNLPGVQTALTDGAESTHRGVVISKAQRP